MADLPPLNWLRAFEASARNLSFTGAARDLNMTQSAVSQQIKSLEGFLGRPLFHRRTRALELTQTGISYLPVVRDAFRTLAHGTRALTRNENDVLQVQCNLTFAIQWLAPRLAQFRCAHPDIQVNISTELWEARDMAEGADVEIRYSLRPSDQVHAELLARDHYYPVCAPGYPVTLATLADQPLYDCANMMGTWAVWAEEQALPWSAPPVTYATTYSIPLSVAVASGGMALGHDIITQGLIDAGHLTVPFSHRARMQEAYYLIQSPRAQAMPAAQAFSNWLRHGLATQVA
ncbi:Glycine cleavage system transcriptional activator [Roseobacter fucihabitans]|uniref:Glycine cleavage system transcriptional activator n=1 Tax=Roseobacter fucihabitans TaxID=1537242 RepID=A0ABZ2BN76_9RHOB|nr:LysR substrate-binding domain-containing protein [Roseobacter litoralis]MBC6964704.1 Glycine cleavage system transcriptional activator [Roseobacter litoralis]